MDTDVKLGPVENSMAGNPEIKKLQTPDPNRVVLRMEILVNASGHVNVKNFPADEMATRSIMVSAMKALDAYYKKQAK